MPSDMIQINGPRLRRWRVAAVYTQEKFAEVLGYDERTLRTAETQGRISAVLAGIICKLLNKSLADLVRSTPDLLVAVLDGISPEQKDLWDSSLKCHERLFRNANAQISRTYLEFWFKELKFRKENSTTWQEFYAVVYEDTAPPRNVVGLAQLSGERNWKFWYCTRLGVLPEFRGGLVVEELLFKAIREQACPLVPEAKTFVWEVEAPDMLLLNDLRHHLMTGAKLRQWPDPERMAHALRSARRLEIFGGIHALLATTPSGEPLTITSPAWTKPLDSSNEREMMLMLHPLGGNLSRPHPSILETMDFLYSGLYADSFGSASVNIEGYDPYVQKLLSRMKAKAKDSGWGPIPLFADLITQAKAEGLWDEITLIEAEK